LLLRLLAVVRIKPIRRGECTPFVSLIIPVYNGQARIATKLNECLELDYPHDRIEIIVASDCSDDGTHDIVKSFASRGIRLVRLEARLGKHSAQGKALESAIGEVIVFTDVGVSLPAQSIRLLARNFNDPDVFCVSSVDRVIVDDKDINSESSYIRYDMAIRLLESRISSSTGASGAFFAVRRELCDGWRPHLSNDFYLPLLAVKRNKRAILDPDVLCHYRLVSTYEEEFSRKVRTIVHGFWVLWEFKSLLNPFRYGVFAIQLLSHKLLRWLVPFFLMIAILTNAVLAASNTVYAILLAVQLVGYVAGVAAFMFPSLQKQMALRTLYFFLVANTAIVVAWLKTLSGEKYLQWSPSKR
jgi:cellulose synthase/poly-beta-1,6-N-acetylglucosamine synthase-like glycosyltransferase